MMDSQLVQTFGLVLVHFAWQGVLIGLLFAAGRFALTDSSAVARYNWATLCLILLALAPVLTFAWLATGTGNHAVPGLTTMSESVQAGVASSASGSSGWALSAFLPVIVGLWFCGVSIMSVRLGAGWWYVRQLRRRADYRMPQEIQARLEDIATQLDMARHVGLAFSNQIAGPMLIGVFRPLILLPTGLVNRLSPRQVEMVLAHELAHLQRADHLVNLFQNVVETLLFYHPVVRWISGEIRAERELASDEQVARLTGDRITYAETLLKLEKARGNRPQFAIGMADHQLLTRVRHLLAPKPRQPGTAVSGVALLSVVLVSAIAALASTGLRALSDSDTPEANSPQAVVESNTGPAGSTVIETQARETPDHAPRQPEPELPPVEAAVEPVISQPAEQRGAIEPVEKVESIQLTSAEIPTEPLDTVSTSDEISTPDETVIDLPSAVDETPPEMSLGPNESDTTVADSPAQTAPEASPGEPMQLAALQPVPATEIRGGSLLEQAVPTYPTGAVRKGREGRAEVRLTVDRDGRVIDAEIVEEMPSGYGFGKAAVQAVEQWRFEPFTRNGTAIRHEIQTGFDFTDPPTCESITGTRLSRC